MEDTIKAAFYWDMKTYSKEDVEKDKSWGLYTYDEVKCTYCKTSMGFYYRIVFGYQFQYNMQFECNDCITIKKPL